MSVSKFRAPAGLLPTLALLGSLAACAPIPAHAAAAPSGPPLTIVRAPGPIVIDGDLSDAGWQGVAPITTWYETKVGDNVEPQVRNVGWLAYDDHYLYAAFRFDDPHPEQIRAPIADHDQLSSSTDYGGVVIDSNNDGKSGVLFLANPRGLLYDAVTNDASGEDSSPDFYWESAGRITSTGWTLEMRIPFSSLRYSRADPQTWGVMLYRNYPRDRHYQFFSTRMPRDANCFVCNENKLTGLTGLPHASHLVVAPFATAQRVDAPGHGPGTELVPGETRTRAGLDVKWSPLASLALDATVRPDFSQVEADVAQIGANERFALFYPEKRSFFLEGIDLFATPLQAVYTRSITAPSGGARATGRMGSTSFTALGARDDGGGTVILPGPEGSGFAPQDFRSDVGVLRVRHDLGSSFVGLLATARAVDGGGHNVVAGPDVEWRPRPTDTFDAQALWSDSRTPDAPTLAGEWDARRLRDRALLVRGSHVTRKLDLFLQGQDLGPSFRADEGFVPQVGFREAYFEGGWTVRPKDAFLSRLRLFDIESYDEDVDGHVLARRACVGAGMDGRWNSFTRVELNREDLRAGSRLFTRFRPYVTVQTSPNRAINNLVLEAWVGDEVDFDNARKGSGATLSGSVTVRAGNQLELAANASRRWLDVHDDALGSGRLFTAQVERLRATWSFTARAFVRAIGQYVATRRTPGLYTFPVAARGSALSVSALAGYKLDWQTVLYAGYGDDRASNPASARLRPAARQVFAKISYAWQH